MQAAGFVDDGHVAVAAEVHPLHREGDLGVGLSVSGLRRHEIGDRPSLQAGEIGVELQQGVALAEDADDFPAPFSTTTAQPTR